MSVSRVSGILAGTLAGLIWGLAFLIPVLLQGWSPVAVTAGRYLAYGGVSVLLLIAGGAAALRLARRHWGIALQFALTGNVAYYLLLVLGIAWAGGPVTDIIIGCIPITMAIVGNLISRTYPWRSLILPVGLVTAGLVLVNIVAAETHQSQPGRSAGLFAAGVVCSFAAVALWTWYGIANAAFVKKYPEVGSGAWSAIVGVGTGLVTLVALPLALATGQLRIPQGGPGSGLSPLTQLIIGSVVLGVVVSWLATMLWNSASARMSTTAAGMLVNIETVSGYTYLYAAARHWPPLGELAGFALILLGVIIVVRLPSSASRDTATLTAQDAQPVPGRPSQRP